MKKCLSLLVLVALLGATGANAWAAECKGVKYADTIEVDGKTLVLNGMGVREATIFYINVYVAALWVDKKSNDPKVLLDTSTPKRLEMTFVRDVDRSDIVGAYKESFEKAPKATQQKLKADFDKLVSWMSDIKKGEKQTFTYIPGKGMEVKTKGKVHGTIAGEDAAQFFLNIWLGPNPPNKGLKTGLLGGKCG